jgi:hypothetical protein
MAFTQHGSSKASPIFFGSISDKKLTYKQVLLVDLLLV